MRKRGPRFHLLAIPVVLLAGMGTAAAQPPPAPDTAVRPPIWDASAGLGLHYLSTRELGEPDDWLEIKGQFRFQVGRYLTSHLKAEFALTAPVRYELYDFDRFPVAGLRDGGFASTDRTVRAMTVTPAFTYQFLENSWAHPFASSGLSVGLFEEHRHRDQTTYRVSGISYTVPAVDARRRFILARPIVAAGFKSYLSDRWFVRPEIATAFDSKGTSQTSLRLDVGVDF